MTANQFIKIGRLLAMFAVALGSIASGMATEAPSVSDVSNTIESVDYSAMPGGKVLVKVTFKQEPKEAPAAFTTNTPPRITLDFVNVGNGLPRKTINVGDGLLRSMSAVQAENRTRLVLNLTAKSAYSTSVEGKNVLIILQGNARTGAGEDAVTRFSQPTASGVKNAVKNVDFQRGKNGEGRIVVDLEDAGSGIDIRRQGKNLVIDFLNSGVAEKMERRLNVVNFATPVLTVDTFTQGQNARMVIEPKGDWEHSAYQTDRRFIVEIKPVVFDPNKLVPGTKTGFGGEKLSLDFNGIDVKSLLRIIGDFTGKNVVVSDAVEGTITLRLKDVPWDEALDIIMKQKKLGMDNMGNTLVFAPQSEIAARKKEEHDLENQLIENKPLITQSFSIKYQKASDIKVLITDPKQPLLTKRGTAVIDPVTNTLFVKDIDDTMTKIDEILKKIDVQTRQVVIQTRMVYAKSNFAKQLGARFGLQKKTGVIGVSGGSDPATGVTSGSGISNALAQGGAIGTTSELGSNLPTGSLGTLALSLFKLPAGFMLDLELSAAESDSVSKTISSPSVLTANQKKATFKYGNKTYVSVIENNSVNTKEIDATTTLDVTPQITKDNTVNMEVNVAKRSIEGYTPGTNEPIISERSVLTTATVGNGETAVLGGFMEDTAGNGVSKVPFFGDLPLVGVLFRSTSKSDLKEEMLFFITPKITSDTMQLN